MLNRRSERDKTNAENALNDEKLDAVNGGMKITVIKDPKNLSKILPFLFKLKKKQN